MSFPTRAVWFDAVWPTMGLFRTLVAQQGEDELLKAAQAAEDNPDKTFMLVVEDFDLFNSEIPELWRRMPPEGGMPTNVWVGAAFATKDELFERADRLYKIRASRLFLLAKAKHDSLEDDLAAVLTPWRCAHCGRRGWTKIPTACPSGSICYDMADKIMPQITWVVDMDRHKDSVAREECEQLRVALWDGVSLEVPE